MLSVPHFILLHVAVFKIKLIQTNCCVPPNPTPPHPSPKLLGIQKISCLHFGQNWLKGFHCLNKRSKCNAFVVGWLENGVFGAEKHCFLSSQSQRGCVAATSPLQAGCARGHLQETLQSARKLPWMVKLPFGLSGSILAPDRYAIAASCRSNHSINNGPDLNRDFFVQLWLEDSKRRNTEAKRQRKVKKYANDGSQTSFQVSPGRHFSGGSESYDKVKPVFRQPPMSQPVTGFLEPTSVEEAQLAPLLARSNLLITRDIEWANLTLGFEQENRYAIVDVYYPHSPVGYIREQSNLFMRQFLRSRRPFVAYITDALGNELFRVHRPFWWINSSIYTEVNGKEIGVVHRRWHLWKRIYDLYLGNEQFAVVENPGFWNWTFTLKDINGEVLAEIDRYWRGFGFELFTDAGQYAIRFGTIDSSLPHGENQELEVKFPLTLAQRAVAVALAISLDNDYFSRHGGWGLPFFVVGE